MLSYAGQSEGLGCHAPCHAQPQQLGARWHGLTWIKRRNREIGVGCLVMADHGGKPDRSHSPALYH